MSCGLTDFGRDVVHLMNDPGMVDKDDNSIKGPCFFCELAEHAVQAGGVVGSIPITPTLLEKPEQAEMFVSGFSFFGAEIGE